MHSGPKEHVTSSLVRRVNKKSFTKINWKHEGSLYWSEDKRLEMVITGWLNYRDKFPEGGFPGGTSGIENPPVDAGDARDVGSIPGSGRCPEGSHGNLFQYSCLQNLMDRGAWQATVHRVTKSWTWMKQLKHAHVHTKNVVKPSVDPNGMALLE